MRAVSSGPGSKLQNATGDASTLTMGNACRQDPKMGNEPDACRQAVTLEYPRSEGVCEPPLSLELLYMPMFHLFLQTEPCAFKINVSTH